MPTFLEYQNVPYTDVAEVIFLGGSSMTSATATGFSLISGSIRVQFSGTGLTYSGNILAGGSIDQFVVYQTRAGGEVAMIQGDSNFTLLSMAEYNAAIALFDAGDLTGAVAGVTASWTMEPFGHTTYVGGLLKGYGGDDALSGSQFADRIFGNGGGDTIQLNSGDDRGYGGDGNDFIYAGTGNDLANGGAGADNLRGEDGLDTLTGGSVTTFFLAGPAMISLPAVPALIRCRAMAALTDWMAARAMTV